jgi:hypothetical protein
LSLVRVKRQKTDYIHNDDCENDAYLAYKKRKEEENE